MCGGRAPLGDANARKPMSEHRGMTSNGIRLYFPARQRKHIQDRAHQEAGHIRLQHLQTGNFDLTIFDVIETEHDATVENYMHRRLATKKIINGAASNEFYAASIDELQPIIAEAKDYNRKYLPTIENAKEVGAKEPDGSINEPGDSTKDMHRELLEIEEKMAQLGSRFD
jgi:hypothetical protein